MQIHELPSGTLTSSDVVAIDNGTSTRKTTLPAAMDVVYAKTTGAITLSSNVTATSSFSCICEKRGNFVTVYIAFTATEDIATSATVATIPSGFRPPRQFRTVVYKSGGYGVLQFNTSGTINAIAAISNTNTVIGIVSYVL